MKTKECTICAGDVFANQFPKIPHADAAEHARDVCFKCWEQHLHSELENKEWNQISCAQCDHILTEAEIKKLDTSFISRIYQQWLDKAAKAFRERDEEFRECPSATCSYGYFHSTKDDGNIFRCQLCESRYCVLCEVPMHENMTCDLYRESKRQEAEAENDRKRKREMADEEELSAKKVKAVSKKCPNPKCGINLDKYTGCDHVTCRKCKHEFCWLCFAPYSGPQGIRKIGNRAHSRSCRYHPSALPDYRPVAVATPGWL
ncbi:hypothetical protein M409DRAFT_27188 [Zasmidium cellare ATCC 36951]|uniref:RBR-type E3 ubiquitin transferase n=1 Tax=Zasmidium cellare ATCC 36951 TaxID=1080233 RepID=A0A6A6CAT2_ZASCE|nr:uncharacterized protein M409DRAFT_27188 [Zasmidium cellare ATCC 36951]KAF2162566.1 hypothetical protein M409DRAFT_27188 [Zasmidium cellare ATCC 36951]